MATSTQPGARPLALALALVPPLALAARTGAKTVTRRLCRYQPAGSCRYVMNGNGDKAFHIFDAPALPGGIGFLGVHPQTTDHRFPCPMGGPGARLWVRERASIVAAVHRASKRGRIRRVDLQYEADGTRRNGVEWPARLCWIPRPGYCVPNGVHREGARTFLEAVAVRAERLQDITEEDARAEGVVCSAGQHPVDAFAALWDSLAPAGAHWDDNPWVWRVAFRRVEGPRP